MFTLNCIGRLLIIDKPIVMGIINITPDSFYSASQKPNLSDALTLAEKMIAEGAAILDIGGQSTRPGSKQISGTSPQSLASCCSRLRASPRRQAFPSSHSPCFLALWRPRLLWSSTAGPQLPDCSSAWCARTALCLRFRCSLSICIAERELNRACASLSADFFCPASFTSYGDGTTSSIFFRCRFM